MTEEKKTIALLGSTGKVGGWVLEEALERGYKIRALVRKPDKIPQSLRDNASLTLIQGSATEATAVEQLLEDDNISVLISTLGSPNPQTLIMTDAAKALAEVLKKLKKEDAMRVLWLTTTGVNDAIVQAKSYGCSGKCCPSTRLCCGYGPFGCLVMRCLVPFLITQNLWDDMGTSEDIFLSSPGDYASFWKNVCIIRPTNMWPASEHAAFTDEWRKEGGEETSYATRSASDPPPNMWITRRAISAFLLDCIDDTQYDSTAVSLFQG